MSMSNTEKHVKDIRRKTRRKFSSEEKIRIVLDGLRGEYSIAELCRREARTDEVIDLKKVNRDLKQAVAELYLRNDWLKKSLTGQGVILEED